MSVLPPQCTGTSTNSEYPDEMSHHVAFHQGLHCLHRQIQSSKKEIQYSLEIKICTLNNDVAMTLKKYAHQRETTVSSNDSLQLCPFSKMGISLKGKNLLPEGANSFL